MLEKKDASKFIKETRELLNLTRKNLSLILGVSEPTIIRWEGAQKGKEATSIDKHNLQLLETLNWLYDEVRKEKSNVRLKYIYSLILGSSESKKAMESMKTLGFGWITIGLTAVASIATIPLGLVFGGQLNNALILGKLALNKKSNEELFKKLTTYTQLYGAKGSLYIAGQIKEGIELK